MLILLKLLCLSVNVNYCKLREAATCIHRPQVKWTPDKYSNISPPPPLSVDFPFPWSQASATQVQGPQAWKFQMDTTQDKKFLTISLALTSVSCLCQSQQVSSQLKTIPHMPITDASGGISHRPEPPHQAPQTAGKQKWPARPGLVPQTLDIEQSGYPPVPTPLSLLVLYHSSLPGPQQQ